MDPKLPPPPNMENAINDGLTQGLTWFGVHFWPYLLLIALVAVANTWLNGKLAIVNERRRIEREERIKHEIRSRG
jgi:hypothetical protein